MNRFLDRSVVLHSNCAVTASSGLYLPDGSRYQNREIHSDKQPKRIIVTGTLALAPDAQCGRRLVETIRDPKNPEALAFLDWQDGQWSIVSEIEYGGQVYAPPSPSHGLVSNLMLPTGIGPCGDLKELLSDIGTTISDFVEISDRDLLLAQSCMLGSWFPDVFDDVPYLALIGPLGSAKTKLLKLMSCFCRRALLIGDIRPAALYQLVDSLDCTLLIDELEIGRSNSDREILRLLRTGSTRGIGAVRNGRFFSTYGFKVIAARHLPADAALSSRFAAISLLPTRKESKILDEKEMRSIADKFQPRLLAFRVTHHEAIRRFRLRPCDLDGMAPRARQLARVLAAPLENDSQVQSDLIAVLQEQDGQMQVERSLEPEWLVVEALFGLDHERLPRGARNISVLVGGVASDVNAMLEERGENLRMTARQAGAVLNSVGFKTERIGNMGRGLKLTHGFRRKVHDVARNLGIDRRDIAYNACQEQGYGGLPCALCEEFGITGGLRFVAPEPAKPRRQVGPPRVSIFTQAEHEGTEES